MLRRKIDSFLQKWHSRDDRLPLIVKGARQTGKTTSIREFAEKNYDSLVEINFIEMPVYKHIFDDGYDPDMIIKNISFINPDFAFIPGKTLIFFDEVQAYMDATTSLKFFAQDHRYDVICSGSALGVQYKNVSSVSVGYKEDYDMRSLDFEEFLWAAGYGDDTVEYLLQNIKDLKPFSELVLEQFNDLFMDYIITGGMPAVVSRYVASKNFSGLLDMQKQILLGYDQDIIKYTSGLDAAKVRNVYHHVASQLGKENHKFQITRLGHGARSWRYQGCFEWLEDAGVIYTCWCLNSLSLPIKGNEDPDNFRVYFADSSFLLASLDDESQRDLRENRNLGVYFGAMYENFAAEALKKQNYDLYFYRSRDARTELDFIIHHHNSIVPVEVKADRAGARSLVNVIKEEKQIEWGIKFGKFNIGAQNRILTLPLFTMFLLRRALNDNDRCPLSEFIAENEEGK